MKAILYIGHGTRSKKGSLEAKGFIEKVMSRIDVPIQEICFLELTEPLIHDGFKRCVEKGAKEIHVVPLFLLSAGHIKEDIPETLESLKLIYPDVEVKISDPFGVQGEILDAVTDLVTAMVADIVREDRVLIVGRGSSDPGILADFDKIASGIKERLNVESVSVCYLAAAKPNLAEGLELITNSGLGRSIVIPYLLFSGLLLAEIDQEVRKLRKRGYEILHTGPLSGHRVIEDIVINRAVG
ncbi:sirohydrochlorin chelatase [Neobacillus sp. K501]